MANKAKVNKISKVEIENIYTEIFLAGREKMQNVAERALFNGRIDGKLQKRFHKFIHSSLEMEIVFLRLQGIQNTYVKKLNSGPYETRKKRVNKVKNNE